MTNRPDRRTILLATGAVGAAAFTAGCGGSGGSGGGDSSSGASPGDELTTTAEVPVGGGKILADQKVVVTQPKEGEFKAFSAICTHQQCVVATVADGTIDCACHGSKFAIADGAVASPPATRPLPAKKITVVGNSIRLA
ncbi:iron-sulfur protein [Streptomyces zinciresistens K42]|uniref:Cytochrome bc1 complex Rieske iron-sulfur subunit n=1 Tax=Streptomyces zinciresistens K42 TaxID=700597 RepID=G2GCH1_9ACTN|nr:Rieske (2Fe-2S) protein [Streptomyces zinciresistens]EGX58774.1 iron-sulfur protein [Streptomyces zinciresistens K42]